MAELADITIVTVAFNSAEPLRGMLETVPSKVSVIIVDNASQDVDDLRTVADEFPNSKIITATENLGFGGACNLGAAEARSEYILFLNPDTRLENGALETLLAAAKTFPSASAFNPKLIDDDGRIRYKRHNHLLPRARKMPRGMGDGPFDVCVLVGAAIFVSRANFEKVSGFDPAIFLYFEDDDISVRLEKQCGPLMIVPAAVVTHARGESSGSSTTMSAFKSWHFGYARVYTTVKHRRPFARTSSLVTALRKLLNLAMLSDGAERAGRWANLRGTTAAIVGIKATKDSGR